MFLDMYVLTSKLLVTFNFFIMIDSSSYDILFVVKYIIVAKKKNDNRVIL